MAKTNESNIKLPELFATSAFRIPNYQRGYAWGEKQLDDLWEDIMDIEKDNDGEYRKHYTGTISLKEIAKKDLPVEEQWLKDKGVSFFDVVDGQQRLTTLVILMYELIRAYTDDYLDEKDDLIRNYLYRKKKNDSTLKVYLFSYKEDDKNRNFLLSRIFGDESVILPTDYVNVYTNNLAFAQKWFRGKIEKLDSAAKADLMVRMQNALVFDTKYIDDNLSVQAVFETMNNRGKPLTILEKLKNRLLFLTAKLNADDDEILALSKNINGAWRNIYDCLGKNPDKVLNEDEFLSAHLSVYRKPADYTFSVELAERKVFEMFCNRAQNYLLDYTREQGENAEHEPAVSFNKIQEYVKDISDLVPFWYEIHNSSDIRLTKIQILNSSKEMKVLLAVLMSLKSSHLQEVDMCLDKVMRILFRDSILGLSVMDERTFATRAREIHQKELTLADFITDLDALLRTPCSVESMLNYYKGLFTYQRGAKGYHRWGGLKFFLMEYEEHLKTDVFQETDNHVSWNNFYNITIEHILPQSFLENWAPVMSEYLKVRNITEEDKDQAYKIIINTLGNLTILKDIKNSSLHNEPWKIKRDRYKSGSYNEIDISNNDDWNKDTIAARGKDMLTFMASKISGLSFSDQQADDLLFMSEKYYPYPEITE